MAYSWTYGGIRAEDLFLQTSHVRRDIMPPVNVVTVPIPGRDGDQFVQANLDMRTITIDVFIIGTDMADAENKVYEISAFLDPHTGPKPLIFDDNTDLIYDAVVQGATDITQILALKQGQITFLVPDALGYSATEETIPFNPMELTRGSAAATIHGGWVNSTNYGIYDFDIGGHNPDYDIVTNTNIAHITGHVPRYLDDFIRIDPYAEAYIAGVQVEEGTTNLLSNDRANAFLTSPFTAVGSVLTSLQTAGSYQSAKYNPLAYGLYVDLNGGIAVEGVYGTVAASSGVTYTFSASVANIGTDKPNLYLRIEMYNVGLALLSTADSPAYAASATGGTQRFQHTFTTAIQTVSLRLYVITKEAHTTNVQFVTNCWQLEQKGYATSWHYGVGNPDGNVRSPELMQIRTAGMITGSQGTVQIIWSPSGTIPNPYGVLFDWGEFDVGNAKDRMAILHGTSVGTPRRTFQFSLTNGTTFANTTATATMSIATSAFMKYYVCIRWNLTGNISTGFVKLDVYDLRTGERLTNYLTTALPAIPFTNYPKANIGHNHGGANWENCIFLNIRFDKTALSDTDINAAIAGLTFEGSNPLTITTPGAIRYPFNGDQMPTLYLPSGTVSTQKGYFLFQNSSGIGELKLYNNNAAQFVWSTNGEWLTEYNFINHTFLSGNVTVPEDLNIHMEWLAFTSIFFPLLTKNEMTFYVTSDNDVSLQAFRKIMGTGNYFIYRPRYI